MIGGGLQRSTEDTRDLKFGAVHPPINLNEIVDFDVFQYDEVLDQGTNDKCTGYGMAKILEAHERVKLSPDFLFAKGKELEGNPESWGLQLRTIFKVATKVGALEKQDVPSDINPETARDGKLWPADKASKHRQQSYFFIEQDGYPSLFWAIVGALWQYKDKQNVAGAGCLWEQDWLNLAKISTMGNTGFGHFFAAVGLKHFDNKPYLKILNSGGDKVGDKGYFYLTEEVVNNKFDYGVGMLIDIPPEKAKFYAQNNIRLTDNWIVVFLKTIKSFFV